MIKMDAINALIDTVNGWLYGYVLVALLVAGGIYFTVRLQFLPTALLKEALRTLAARGGRSSGAMSSFQALMVSTASRVGTGNYFYAEQSVRYLYPNAHFNRGFMTSYRIVAILVIFAGSQFKAAFAWNLSDLVMGVMALINIPVCVYLGKNVYKVLWDYMIQRNRGKEPTFDPKKVLGTSEGMECWMEN